METIELDDVQRLVIQGYPARPAAMYALLEVTDPTCARSWIGGLLPWIGSSDAESRRRDREAPPERRLALAFTWAGLVKLGFPASYGESAGFVGEFREGMVAPHRSRILGDRRESAPCHWRWGRPEDAIHALLIVFSRSRAALDADWETVRGELDGVALWGSAREGHQNPIYGYVVEQHTEHFGFKDGISQPYIAGSDTHMRPSGRHAAGATVAPGEFILGYRNEMGKLPASPGVPKEVDRRTILAVHPENPAEQRDFGRNGSYLVLRQLEQDVRRFDDFVDQAAAAAGVDRERFAARLVGRQKDGTPLVDAPDDNDFGYHAEDRHGLRCPVGAHIRRANPRDAFADPEMRISREEAQGLVNRHRLIRRGRLYGEKDPDVEGERGLLFVCLNANLQRQFEFVQQHWINGPKFGGLDDELDPIVGAQPASGGRMTIQARPVSTQVVDLPRFVTVRGGAYFFLPGLRALRFLARLDPARWPEPTRDFGFPRFRRRRPWLSADLQTAANQLRRNPGLRRLERSREPLAFPMDDGSGDALRGSLHRPCRRDDGRPLVVVIHGLPGSEKSEVVLHSAAYFLARGHPVLRLNQRGAGPSKGQTTRIYHAGRSEDLRRVVLQLPDEFRETGIVLLAYSLGANVMLKMLGEGNYGDRVRAAVSVSAPIDLAATAEHLLRLRGLRRQAYVRTLLRKTKRCALAIRGLGSAWRGPIAKARSFREFDQDFLAPFNGFSGADEYYELSSSAGILGRIRVPTLLIHAQDDPIVPWRDVDRRANDRLTTLFPATGGHAGFHLRGSRSTWHDRCAEIFFSR